MPMAEVHPPPSPPSISFVPSMNVSEESAQGWGAGAVGEGERISDTPMYAFNNLNIDEVQVMTDHSGIHMVFDADAALVGFKRREGVTKLQVDNIADLVKFDQWQPQGTNGILVHYDAYKLMVAGVTFRQGLYSLQTATEVLNAKLKAWIDHIASQAKRGHRPTLFNLLEALARDNTTTPQQRSDIRAIVTDFLNNDIPHARVYGFITSIIGYDRLRSIIGTLENDPAGSSVPHADGLARIEAAFGLRKTNGIPATGKEDPAKQIKKTSEKTEVLNKVKWLPVKRTLCTGPLFGHSVIVFCSKAFMFGGSNDRSELLSFRWCSVLNLFDFTSRQVAFAGDVPCDRDGHTMNLITLPGGWSGVAVFGGNGGDRLLNDICVLNFETKLWKCIAPSGQAPPCRDQHTAVVLTDVLFVFGGRTADGCLDDMWSFDWRSSVWREIICNQKPGPRFGVCMVWTDDSTMCLFGGENKSTLLNDMWTIKLSGDKLHGEWNREIYEGIMAPRSHYACIFITQRYQDPSGADSQAVEKLMVLTGGLALDNGEPSETDDINVYFFSQKRWFKLKPRYPGDYCGESFEARQRHVTCFFEAKNRLDNSRGGVPCLLVHGGFRKNQVFSDAWVLALTGEDPYKVSGQQLAKPYQKDFFTPGVLWSLSSVQHWALGSIAHLVDNSVAAKAKTIKITYDGMLRVQDDGHGLDFAAMNRLLRLYATYEPGDTSRSNYEYGIGFKCAYSRLASSCAVMSRTHGTIGIGMISQELMSHCDAKEIAAPLCVWRLPNKEVINRDPNNGTDHRNHQRLLMTYSPFTTPTLLAEQINVLGTSPGTRLVFWDMRGDLDNLCVCGDQIVINAAQQVNEETEGPLWKDPLYSIDNCLGTYLHWLYLHLTPTISLSDKLIQHPPSKRHEDTMSTKIGTLTLSHASDEYKASLIKYLKTNLYSMVELPYLFKPQDSQMGCYAILGFSNDPNVAERTYAETGVLLYFKQRLIRRLEGHFPADPVDVINTSKQPPDEDSFNQGIFSPFIMTAVINVPDCMIPSMTKQSFVHEGNLPWFVFKKRLVALLGSYLAVCRYPEKLKLWEDNRLSRYNTFYNGITTNRDDDSMPEDL
eukprot:GHVQ01019079.1.p1 GENE.GHVQ01019079.1~~GHVQ01019079.1.p1  ORF type:complete len:1102 (+),score=139.66 GHVQ01019079.1:142-3447(+)